MNVAVPAGGAIPRLPIRLAGLGAVAICVLLLTVPRGVIDYGQSGDAWDNARDAQVLRTMGIAQGVPELVRFPPGIPLFWSVLVPFANSGPVGTNAVVFLFYLACVYLFWQIVRNERHRVLLAITFALTPILLKNAAVTQDFVVGLAFILAAYLALTRQRYLLAGLCIGLAAGVRVTHILFAAPCVVLLLLDRSTSVRSRLLQSATLLAMAGTMAVVLFLPLLAYAGPEIFVPGEPYGKFRLLAAVVPATYNLVTVFGVQALIAILVAMIIERRSIQARVSADTRNRVPTTAFAVLAVLIHVAIVLRFTMKPEYFLPAVPFLYLLLGRYLSRRSLAIVSILLVSHAVVSIELKGGRSGQRALTFRPAPGLVVEDYFERRDMRDLRNGIAALGAMGRAIVLTGVGGPLTVDNPALSAAVPSDISARLGADAAWTPHRKIGSSVINRVTGSQVFLLSTMSKGNVELLKAEGYRVLMFDKYAPGALRSTYGYDPYAAGIETIAISGRQAFYRH